MQQICNLVATRCDLFAIFFFFFFQHVAHVELTSCQVLNPNSQEYMHTQGAQFKFFSPLFGQHKVHTHTRVRTGQG